MGIVSTLQAMHTRLEKVKDTIYLAIPKALEKAGKEIVQDARDSKTYKDRTGNLTASMGYGVYQYGKECSIGGFGGGKGEEQGRIELEQRAKELSHLPFCLIIVAGMEYAVYVERCGYVVLDHARLMSDSIIQDALQAEMKL